MREATVTEQATAQVTSTATPPFEYDGNIVISVNISNLEQSLEWYREALGCQEIVEPGALAFPSAAATA